MKDFVPTFFSLIRFGIGTETHDDKKAEQFLSLSMMQWRKVISLADKQGVSAIAIDGMQRLYDIYGKKLKAVYETPVDWTQWVFECVGTMTQYEQMSRAQRKVISDLSEILEKNGIRLMVFKGQANASFYPVPEHRATGDIDCWLFDDAEKGDDVLKEKGAVVDNRWYRHSKISYKGETIENHRVMSHTRGSRKKKEMEEELRLMVNDSRLSVINCCGKALMPTAQFDASFLTYHGLHHFLSEGLRMKQILDWAMFLKAEQDKVDWETYNDFCKRYKLDRFAAVMNYIAGHYLGVNLNENDNKNENVRELAEKVIQSTLFDDDYLFNSGKGDWMVRWLLVKNMLTKDKWKYRDIAQESVCKHLWENVKGFVSKEEE